MNISNTKTVVFSSFTIGDLVQVIDSGETISECACFVISGINNNRFLLKTLDDQNTYDEPLWVDATEIVFYQ